jgi:hypothetical protein
LIVFMLFPTHIFFFFIFNGWIGAGAVQDLGREVIRSGMDAGVAPSPVRAAPPASARSGGLAQRDPNVQQQAHTPAAAAEKKPVKKAAARPSTPGAVKTPRPSTGASAAAAAAAVVSEDASSAPSGPSKQELRLQGKFVPVSEEEFEALSSLVRGRLKLSMLNEDIYQILYNHFKDIPKKAREPIDAVALTKLGAKVTGATGENGLNSLRHLKIITTTKKGYVLN